MAVNVGKSDRGLRYGLGLVLILAPLWDLIVLPLANWVVVLAVIAGAILMVTAAVRFCPLYRVIGASTCRR